MTLDFFHRLPHIHHPKRNKHRQTTLSLAYVIYYSKDSLYPIEAVNLCVTIEFDQFTYKIALGWYFLLAFL